MKVTKTVKKMRRQMIARRRRELDESSSDWDWEETRLATVACDSSLASDSA